MACAFYSCLIFFGSAPRLKYSVFFLFFEMFLSCSTFLPFPPIWRATSTLFHVVFFFFLPFLRLAVCVMVDLQDASCLFVFCVLGAAWLSFLDLRQPQGPLFRFAMMCPVLDATRFSSCLPAGLCAFRRVFSVLLFPSFPPFSGFPQAVPRVVFLLSPET